MKKNYLLITMFIISSSYGSTYFEGDDYFSLSNKALIEYQAKNYVAAAHLYFSAYKLVIDNFKGYGNIRYDGSYNAACCWALSGETDSAFNMLYLSINKGHLNNYELISNDRDLNSLHKFSKWDSVLEMVKSNVEIDNRNLDTAMVSQLREIRRKDQEFRVKLDNLRKEPGKVNAYIDSNLRNNLHFYDSINQIKVKQIIDKYGWLGADKIGELGVQTLFLVIQHADIETQIKYLPKMQEAVKNGKALAKDLAFLEDRIALRQGKKQIYGTQLWFNRSTGRTYAQPVVDPENLDKRRSAVWLEPMSEYLGQFKETWNAKEYIKNLPGIEAEMKKN